MEANRKYLQYLYKILGSFSAGGTGRHTYLSVPNSVTVWQRAETGYP